MRTRIVAGKTSVQSVMAAPGRSSSAAQAGKTAKYSEVARSKTIRVRNRRSRRAVSPDVAIRREPWSTPKASRTKSKQTTAWKESSIATVAGVVETHRSGPVKLQ
jgi:hypothetical protein